MAKNKVTIESGLKKDLQKYSMEICRIAAHEVSDEMEKTHHYAMSLFYSDYRPIRYHRHYYNFNERVYKKYYEKPHNAYQAAYGGIEISLDFLDRIYRGSIDGEKVDSTDIVYNLVYMQGRHGMAENFGASPSPITSPSPIEHLKLKQKEIVKNSDLYVTKGIDIANKGAYSFISPL